MKKILTFLLFYSLAIVNAQESSKLDYCNCIDKIGSTSPALEGMFERTCNGILIERGLFKKGLKDGEWVTYSRKGKLIRRINYSDGKLNGKSELFYLNGTPRLTASFMEGKPVGKWTYLTTSGKVRLSGEYNDGRPVGEWKGSDAKGKALVFSYDYGAGAYQTYSDKAAYKEKHLVQNDNTEEYAIMFFPAVKQELEGTAPLGGIKYAASFFADLMEIPLDYWDTLISYTYKVKYRITEDHSSSFKLEQISKAEAENLPIFSVVVSTNPDKKLKQIKHTELSAKLLEYKVSEALSFLPPWIYKDNSEVDIEVAYVINKILGGSKLASRN